MHENVITTNPARCRDCYRCVRNCDVKAIRVKDGQAQIIPELCILCGTCVRVCPQKAKGVSSARRDINQALAGGRRLIASVAPSAPAYFAMNDFSDMNEALKKIGFSAAEETVVGAEIVGLAHREYVEKRPDLWPIITSSCPVIVNLVEQYYPELIPHLAPIVSPMIAHGRLLAEKYGPEASIVFIGPCIVKKMEILDASVAGVIDAAMTFKGLQEWFAESGTGLQSSPVTHQALPQAKGRLFPMEGGLAGTARMNTDLLNQRTVFASGLDACQDVLHDMLAGQLHAGMVELMACKGGCINGPAMADLPGGIHVARQKIMNYNEHNQLLMQLPRDAWPPLTRTFRNKKQAVPEFSEEQIQEVLHRVYKYSRDDELNCGACGYSSCREKAAAVLRGMAEVTMCIPYMRRRSESLRQVVMDVSPNPIVMVDYALSIQDMSPSAEILFKCRLGEMKGKHLEGIITCFDDFIHVRETGHPVIAKVSRFREDLVVEQNIVRVEGQALLIAIFHDITEQDQERRKFNALRAETLQRTKEVVMKQMRVAHQIAHLLGETTADSKMIVSHLTKLLEEERSPWDDPMLG